MSTSKKNENHLKPGKLDRRTLLKSLVSVPVLGTMALGIARKKRFEDLYYDSIKEEINLSNPIPKIKPVAKGEKLRVGVIGVGGRGRYLLKAAGFVNPGQLDKLREEGLGNPRDTRYVDFMEQEDLNIEITALCDVYDNRAEWALDSCANLNREGKGAKLGKRPKRYQNYKDLLQSGEVDAVIIATPDHWHAPMAMEAARNGVHVYVEKPMTWTVPETYELRKLVKENNIVFQLGHQGRQTESYIKAKEAIEKDVLGDITLVEVCTNRNSPNGAWVYPIDDDAGPHNIDWKQFLGPAPDHEFSLERFFRWRCWWDYSTGLNGDLLTHEYDAINQIMDVGIPDTAVCSGGIYFFRDGRTVPDVQHTVYEFKDKNLSMLYSATLASNHYRGKTIMGHDASMELGQNLVIKADAESTKYKEKIEAGVIKPDVPIYTYIPGLHNVDGMATATEQYFASRGLLYTYRDGKRHDASHIHIREWIDAIRNNTQPSCNIDEGFEEAITAHMSTISLRKGRRVYWDRDNEKIIMGEKIEKEDFSGNEDENLIIN